MSFREACATQAINARSLEEQAKCFLQLLRNQDIEVARQLSEHIYTLVEDQAVPIKIFSILMNVVTKLHLDFDILAVIEKVNHHVFLQEDLLYIFCHRLRKSQWRMLWDAVGGVDAIGRVCTILSARNLQIFIKRIASTFGKPWRATSETEQLMQQLLVHVLHHDPRPLERYYASLLPACSDNFVTNFDSVTRSSLVKRHVKVFDLVFCHTSLYRRAVLEAKDQVVGYASAISHLVKNIHVSCCDIPGFPPHDHKAFALDILTKMADGSFAPHKSFHNDWFIQTVECLLPGLDITASGSNTISVLQKIAIILQHNSSKSGNLEYDIKPLLSAVATQWQRALQENHSTFETLDGLLQTFCDPVICGVNIWNSLKDFLTYDRNIWIKRVFKHTPVKVRYRLLQRLIQLLHPKKVNIDLQDDIILVKESFFWRTTIFLEMDRADAAGLLNRLRNAPNDVHFLRSDHMFGHQRTESSNTADPLFLYLGRPSFEKAKKLVRARYRNAEKGAEQTDRFDYAYDAFACAIGSQSVRIYADTLHWSRRFIKDALTLKGLCDCDIYNTAELQELLTGFDIHSSISEIQRQVESGSIKETNEVLLAHIDVLTTAMKEPSFRNSWSSLAKKFKIFLHSLIQRRLYYVCRLRTQQAFQVFVRTVIAPSFEVLIRFEEHDLKHTRGSDRRDHNQSRIERLACSDIMDCNYKLFVKNAPPAIQEVLDKYLERRDELWRARRTTYHDPADSLPAAQQSESWKGDEKVDHEFTDWLPEICPRGLPIQRLLPKSIEVTSIENMPFLKNRVYKTLEVVKSADIDTVDIELDGSRKSTVWMDSYFYALKLALKTISEDQKRPFLTEYWNHCKARSLDSQNLMAPEEQYWHERFFSLIGDKPTAQKTSEPYMSIHGVENNTEWMPFVREARKMPSRFNHRKAKALLAMLRTSEDAVRSYLAPFVGSYENWNPDWPWNEFRKLPYKREIRDAYILSSLLYLDSIIGQPTMLLSQPFPSDENERFPATYLDTKFISRMGERTKNDALGVLETLCKEIPTKLLVKVLERWLKKENFRSEEQERNSRDLGYRLIKLLRVSDTPHLAVPFIQEITLNHPDESSWVAQLLTLPFLKRLPVYEAHQFLQKMQMEVFERLQHQRTVLKTAKPEESSLKHSYVKISTLKLIVISIANSGIMSYRSSLDLLSKVLDASNHADVVAAIAKRLIHMLKNIGDDASRVFELLKRIIPRVSGPHERRYPSGEMLEWKEENELPYTYTASDDRPPIMRLLFFDVLDQEMIPESLKCEFFATILLPIYESACRNHMLWLQKFIELHGRSEKQELEGIAAMYMPRIPFSDEMLSWLLQHWIIYLPINKLESLLNVELSYMQYSYSEFSFIDELVKNDPDFRTTNACQHWQEVRDVQNSGCFNDGELLIDALTSVPATNVKDYMFLIERLAKSHLANAVSGSAIGFNRLEELLQKCESSYLFHRNGEKNWIYREVLETIVDVIDRRRTQEWHNSPNRQPVRLPSIIRSKVSLLAWPHKDRNLGIVVYQEFAAQLRQFFDNIVSSQPTYHKDLSIVRKLLKYWTKHVHPNQPWSLAIALCEFDNDTPSSTVDMLLLELSITALRYCKPTSETKLSGMGSFSDKIHRWKQDSNEQLREVAFDTEKILETLKDIAESTNIYDRGDFVISSWRKGSNSSDDESWASSL